MKAYVLVTEMFDTTGKEVVGTIAPFGGQFIVRGGDLTVLEGKWPHRAALKGGITIEPANDQRQQAFTTSAIGVFAGHDLIAAAPLFTITDRLDSSLKGALQPNATGLPTRWRNEPSSCSDCGKLRLIVLTMTGLGVLCDDRHPHHRIS